jgi:hypothetical protein
VIKSFYSDRHGQDSSVTNYHRKRRTSNLRSVAISFDLDIQNYGKHIGQHQTDCMLSPAEFVGSKSRIKRDPAIFSRIISEPINAGSSFDEFIMKFKLASGYASSNLCKSLSLILH